LPGESATRATHRSRFDVRDAHFALAHVQFLLTRNMHVQIA
jgi:hypothetical protein